MVRRGWTVAGTLAHGDARVNPLNRAIMGTVRGGLCGVRWARGADCVVWLSWLGGLRGVRGPGGLCRVRGLCRAR